ncbi:MAG: hypothetical protein EOM91_08230 [Sphingobacteriia bacterium]|nr:hypothetical protein [Sphingobacteriia bacterium]NCC39708.1 hypothetical protein [Gammaproteobacteria bacterium]
MLNTAGLSLEQAPPFAVPARFFLTAPLFAIAVGLILVWEGATPLTSRWLPVTLAATHLIALGYLGQVMCGALLQILPVVAGAPVPAVHLVGTLTHVLLALGASLLAGGLWLGSAVWLWVGGGLTGLGLMVFLIPVALALMRARGAPETLLALRLAAIALLMTLLLGLILVGFLVGRIPLPEFTRWVDIHAAWGLLGWVGGLIVGVGIQVVPMFYVTPAYPTPLRRLLAPLLLGAIALGTIAWILGWDIQARILLGLSALGFLIFALATLALLARRGRRSGDATLWHWLAAMLAIIAAVLLWSFEASATLIGAILLLGLGVGLTAGMLLKIVPFLAWFHLQHRQLATGRFDLRIPHMGRLLAAAWARAQVALHLLAVALLISAFWRPELARPAGVMLVLSQLVLLGLLIGVIRIYQQQCRVLAESLPDR